MIKNKICFLRNCNPNLEFETKSRASWIFGQWCSTISDTLDMRCSFRCGLGSRSSWTWHSCRAASTVGSTCMTLSANTASQGAPVLIKIELIRSRTSELSYKFHKSCPIVLSLAQSQRTLPERLIYPTSFSFMRHRWIFLIWPVNPWYTPSLFNMPHYISPA